MDEYSLLTSEKERSCGKDLEISTCSPNQTWEELSLISEDEEFSLVSSDDEELSLNELVDEKDPAKHDDGPSCSFVADKSVSDCEAGRSETDLSAKRQRTDNPTAVAPLESDETSSSDSSISSHTRVGDTRGPGPSDKEIKESRKKDKGMFRKMFKSLCPSNVHSKFYLFV